MLSDPYYDNRNYATRINIFWHPGLTCEIERFLSHQLIILNEQLPGLMFENLLSSLFTLKPVSFKYPIAIFHISRFLFILLYASVTVFNVLSQFFIIFHALCLCRVLNVYAIVPVFFAFPLYLLFRIAMLFIMLYIFILYNMTFF